MASGVSHVLLPISTSTRDRQRALKAKVGNKATWEAICLCGLDCMEKLFKVAPKNAA